MKRNVIYVLCMLLAALAFALLFAKGSREINLDTSKKPLTPYVIDVEKKGVIQVRRQYHLDSTAYEQVPAYGTAFAMEVNEIAVFKQADKMKREALQKLCQEHTDRQLKNFQGYALRQSALLEKAAVYEDGRYVAALIHPQQSRLRQLLRKVW